MKYHYYKILETFLEECNSDVKTSTPWQLDSFEVANSLLHLLDYPDGINQSPFGFCGEVAFLRSWAYRDPDTIAKFAIELYKTGSSYIGEYEVKASKELLNSTWMKNSYKSPITAAIWMICGALADTCNDFKGSPNDDSGTKTINLVEWLKRTNQYIKDSETHSKETYDNRLWGFILGKQHIDYALKLKPDSYTDVFVCIHSNMFRNVRSIPSVHLPSYEGLHWVMLNKPIVMVDDKVHMNIWTWGQNFKLIISKDHFNKSYDDNHGSIVIHSSTPKRNKPKQFRSLPGPHKII